MSGGRSSTGNRSRLVRVAATLGMCALSNGPGEAGETKPHPAASLQTIVILRHGERAERGLGQLNCQGLNRALALPGVLARKFGKPDFLFAPSPAYEKEDFGKPYSYVRPLATIEPTAIRFGLPLDATLGFSETAKLRKRLEDASFRNAVVVVAWEHHKSVELARDLLEAHGGDAKAVPKWERDNFDSLYVVRIARTGGKSSATFEHAHEGLDGQPTECPVR